MGRSLECFFFNDTATTEIYTLSLHDALPISLRKRCWTRTSRARRMWWWTGWASARSRGRGRSEEHTSELQSRQYLVCRLLLEKKKRMELDRYTKPVYYVYVSHSLHVEYHDQI